MHNVIQVIYTKLRMMYIHIKRTEEGNEHDVLSNFNSLL